METNIQTTSFDMLDTSIVQIVKDEPRVDSREISRILGTRQKSSLNLIRNNFKKLEAFGLMPFKKAEINGKGRPQTYFLLNENQTILLIALSKNTKEVATLKFHFVKAFSEMKERLAARQDGKQFRHIAMDSVKLLVEHAEKQGSTNSERYYLLVTKLVYSVLFNNENINRDQLTKEQLIVLSMAEITIKEEIEFLLKTNPNIHYKEIYKSVKGRIDNLALTLNARQVNHE